jgi:hypothetical protein
MTQKENFLRVIRRENPEWIPCLTEEVHIGDVSPLHDREDNGFDWFGVQWVDSVPMESNPILKDIKDWKAVIKFPNLDELDWKKGAEEDCKGFDRENKAVWIPVRVGLFERIQTFLGFEETLVAFYEEPEAIKDLIDAYTEYRLKVMDKIITYYEPDVMSIHDDFGTQLAMMISPEMWRQFFKENYRRIVKYVHSRDVLFILHSCGKVDDIVGDFVDLNIDAWDSVMFCCDLRNIYKKYGKSISFTTSMNLQELTECSEGEAREMVRDTIDMLGKYGNVIPRDDGPKVPKETLEAVRDEIKTFGRDYYIKNPITEVIK